MDLLVVFGTLAGPILGGAGYLARQVRLGVRDRRDGKLWARLEKSHPVEVLDALVRAREAERPGWGIGRREAPDP